MATSNQDTNIKDVAAPASATTTNIGHVLGLNAAKTQDVLIPLSMLRTVIAAELKTALTAITSGSPDVPVLDGNNLKYMTLANFAKVAGEQMDFMVTDHLGYLDNTKYIKVVAGDIVNCGAVTIDVIYALGSYHKYVLSFYVHTQTGNKIRPKKDIIIGSADSMAPVFYVSQSENAVFIKLNQAQSASVTTTYNVYRTLSRISTSIVDALPGDATEF